MGVGEHLRADIHSKDMAVGSYLRRRKLHNLASTGTNIEYALPIGQGGMCDNPAGDRSYAGSILRSLEVSHLIPGGDLPCQVRSLAIV